MCCSEFFCVVDMEFQVCVIFFVNDFGLMVFWGCMVVEVLVDGMLLCDIWLVLCFEMDVFESWCYGVGWQEFCGC